MEYYLIEEYSAQEVSNEVVTIIEKQMTYINSRVKKIALEIYLKNFSMIIIMLRY